MVHGVILHRYCSCWLCWVCVCAVFCPLLLPLLLICQLDIVIRSRCITGLDVLVGCLALCIGALNRLNGRLRD